MFEGATLLQMLIFSLFFTVCIANGREIKTKSFRFRKEMCFISNILEKTAKEITTYFKYSNKFCDGQSKCDSHLT